MSLKLKLKKKKMVTWQIHNLNFCGVKMEEVGISVGVVIVIVILGLLSLCFLLYVIFPRKNSKMWAGKNVVITGGSMGLGKGIAEVLVSKGASVAIIARRQNALDEAKEDIKKHCNNLLQKVITISADVTNQEDMNKAAEKAEDEFGGPIDYLFCSAGIAQPGLFIDTPTEVFEQQMNLNYLGTVKTIKSFLPSIIKDKKSNPKCKKHIIIVSSAAGLAGFIGYSQYAPTKYAVRGLADCLRNELLLYDIGVSVFHASSMNSPGFENEEKTKPQITREIEGTVKLWEFAFYFYFAIYFIIFLIDLSYIIIIIIWIIFIYSSF